MKKLLAALVLLYCQLSTANCQPFDSNQGYWQQQVNYTIDVSLNDKEHSLTGFEKIEYINHSPDTLRFIWFHIWPNAYKTDKTAFSDQLLENGNTDFYFSSKEQKGYINRLNFKVNNATAEVEDHPHHIDIIKLNLPSPLAPGQKIDITTPFHIKLPYNFSRSGYEGESYQVTQWYPKPAVYDKNGWHPMPYLDQGEFYSEFGSFDVKITVPENYVVAATGELQNQEEKEWLKKRASFSWTPSRKRIKRGGSVKTIVEKFPASSKEIKTLHFKQNRIHDFAWFADKQFIVAHDTCRLSSGKIIDVYSYYTEEQKKYWANSVSFAKDAVKTRSEWIGEYPFSIVSIVQGPESFGGGMEYPSITVISPMEDEKLLDYTIAHEIGHNWFYSILASNERKYPWMDEGMNTYYDNRYSQWKYSKGEMKVGSAHVSIKNAERILFETKAVTKKDQPVNTSSEAFSYNNYAFVAYYKTGAWLEYVESVLGRETFDKAMHEYYQRWQFKHPQPQDFKQVLEETSGKNLDSLFSLLDTKGRLPNQQKQKGITFSFALTGDAISHRFNNPGQDAVVAGPSLGFNSYDKLMIGGLITNYKLPPSRFQFFLAPMYAIGSKKMVGLGNLNYSFYTANTIQKIQIGLGGGFFSKRASMDSMRKKVFEDFYRLTPSVKLVFKANPRSNREQSLEAKTFLIGENNFSDFAMKTTDSLNYVTARESESYYINQVSFTETNFRKLYPYSYNIQLQQGKGFYRANFTGNYFFNYAKGGGGMDVRFFAAKFGFLGNRKKYRLSTLRFQPKLLGVTGEEDFTYSNYFVGRTASFGNDPDAVVTNRGIGGQQIMIRDGAFKLRLDPFDFLQGRSDDWVTALNFSTTLPKGILPFNLPLKIFLDIGTFAGAWEKDAATSRFLYVSGLQLSLFKNFLNIYAPILYSKEFKDNLKTFPDQNTFFKRLTFSIDILNFDARKINRALL